MERLTKDWLAKSLSKYENRTQDDHRWGKVEAVNEDGSYMVRVGDGEPARCSNGCAANVGDVVFTVVTKDGLCVAICRLGGERYETGVTPSDYVAEHGVTDGWHWEKWAGGKAVCWKKCEITPTAWNAWGGIYEASPGLASQAYPFEFSEAPGFSCELSDSGSGGVYIAGFEYGPQGSATASPSVNVLRGATYAEVPAFTVVIRAEGWWKDAPTSGATYAGGDRIAALEARVAALEAALA